MLPGVDGTRSGVRTAAVGLELPRLRFQSASLVDPCVIQPIKAGFVVVFYADALLANQCLMHEQF